MEDGALCERLGASDEKMCSFSCCWRRVAFVSVVVNSRTCFCTR